MVGINNLRGELAALTVPQLRQIIDSEGLPVKKNVGGRDKRTKLDIIADIERARGSSVGHQRATAGADSSTHHEIHSTRTQTQPTGNISGRNSTPVRSTLRGGTIREVPAPAPTELSENIPWQINRGSGAGRTFQGRRIIRSIISGTGTVKNTFFGGRFGECTHTVQVSLQKKQLSGPALGASVDDDGQQWELVAAKMEEDGTQFYGGVKQAIHYVYYPVSGPGWIAVNLQHELEKLANFAGLGNVRKIAARLELLHSPASSKHPLVTLKASDFELIPEEYSYRVAEPMCDGCGFIGDEMLTKCLGRRDVANLPPSIAAIQVRVVAPQLGVFKGVLCRKPGIDKIQLPDSMRKVGPSIVNNEDWACMVIKITAPSQDNITIGRYLAHNTPPCKSFEPKLIQKKSDMVAKLLRAVGVSAETIEKHDREAKRTRMSKCTWLMGVADPTGCLPAGSVFVTGLPSSHIDGLQKLFVTRSPCGIHASDGRMLPIVTLKPSDMPDSTWQWLQRLPFGVICFSAKGANEGRAPLPLLCAGGDLDGDLYFVCWDAAVLAEVVAERPEQEALFYGGGGGAGGGTATATGAVSGAAITTPPTTPRYHPRRAQGSATTTAGPTTATSATAAASASAAVPLRDWFRAAQAYMMDPAVLNSKAMIGKLYNAMKKAQEQSQRGMDDEDAVAFGSAYRQALDIGKHGGSINLPEHLRQKVGLQ